MIKKWVNIGKLVSKKGANLILDSKSKTFNLADSNWEKDALHTVALNVSPAPRVSSTPPGGGNAGLMIRPYKL